MSTAPRTEARATAAIAEIVVRTVKIPLVTPYKVSSQVFDYFDPLVVEMRDADGRIGWGEALISSFYTNETPEGGWAFCNEMAERLVGLTGAAAKALLRPAIRDNSHAASTLLTAIEMLERSALLEVPAPATIPLLAPLHSMDTVTVGREIDALLAEGFRTLKIKVGFDATRDLERMRAIQRAVGGRATLRLDANQGFDRAAACRFAAALDPTGIELFEQPCHKDDWEANAAVAAVSTVPVMLDESIYGIDEIDRAAALPGIGFVKVKLKKLGGLEELARALRHIHAAGLEPVLGDGTATDISCWMEACVARSTIHNAGEMNGFLKLQRRLFETPLPFVDGAIRLPRGFEPRIDRDALGAATEASRRHAPARSTAAQ
jgi:L-alanine-DL-glutamate epimerase-like enolase superfamily enzyme